MGRAPCCEKVGLKKGRWTSEEDEILTKYIQTNGEGSWRSLPMKAGLLRCGKSCRLRWINYLRGDLRRGNITPEEEEVIIKLHSSYGNRWSLIAGHLPGRTDNEIKNYWNSHLSRRIHTIRRLNQDGVPVVLDIGKFVGGPKRRGGRTRRSAFKRSINNNKVEEAPSTKPNHPVQERHKAAGSGPNPDPDNVIALSDEKLESGHESGLSHDDFDNEMLCSDVMDAGAFWGSNEPTESTHDLSPSQGRNVGPHEAEREGGASDLSSDAFDDGIFCANEVCGSRLWGSSNGEKEDDLFTFCQANDDMGREQTGMSTFSYENTLNEILCPNQVSERGFWGSDDESGSRFFASSQSGDAIMGDMGENNMPSLSYDLLENEFELADSVFWGSNECAESDQNMGIESGFLSPGDHVKESGSMMPPENELREPWEDVENGRSGFTKPNQGKVNMVACSSTELKEGGQKLRDNEWSSSGLMADWTSSGLMADWSWEGFEDKFREMEGGDVWPWLLGSDNGGGLGFEDELTKSYAAWVFPTVETNVNL